MAEPTLQEWMDIFEENRDRAKTAIAALPISSECRERYEDIVTELDHDIRHASNQMRKLATAAGKED